MNLTYCFKNSQLQTKILNFKEYSSDDTPQLRHVPGTLKPLQGSPACALTARSPRVLPGWDGLHLPTPAGRHAEKTAQGSEECGSRLALSQPPDVLEAFPPRPGLERRPPFPILPSPRGCELLPNCIVLCSDSLTQKFYFKSKLKSLLEHNNDPVRGNLSSGKSQAPALPFPYALTTGEPGTR